MTLTFCRGCCCSFTASNYGFLSVYASGTAHARSRLWQRVVGRRIWLNEVRGLPLVIQRLERRLIRPLVNLAYLISRMPFSIVPTRRKAVILPLARQIAGLCKTQRRDVAALALLFFLLVFPPVFLNAHVLFELFLIHVSLHRN